MTPREQGGISPARLHGPHDGCCLLTGAVWIEGAIAPHTPSYRLKSSTHSQELLPFSCTARAVDTVRVRARALARS